MTYKKNSMIFIESPIFTEDLSNHLTDAQYWEFQIYLAANPDAGAVMQDTGGLRKVRWSAKMSGKRGGVRVIYYHRVAAHQIRMILIYQKGVKDDLTFAEKKLLRELNKGWQ
jgi:hypothetical protein